MGDVVRTGRGGRTGVGDGDVPVQDPFCDSSPPVTDLGYRRKGDLGKVKTAMKISLGKLSVTSSASGTRARVLSSE